MRPIVLLLTLLLLLAAAGCADSEGPAPLDIDAEAQIYAAAIRQIYSVDHSFGDAPGWPLVFVVTSTDDSAMPDAPEAPSQLLPAELQAAITAELAEAPFELTWVETAFEVPVDPSNGMVAEGEGIIISLGNIHRQDDGSVQLAFFMTCGGLCGIGKTYVLEQVEGEWQVTGSTGPEIMS